MILTELHGTRAEPTWKFVNINGKLIPFCGLAKLGGSRKQPNHTNSRKTPAGSPKGSPNHTIEPAPTAIRTPNRRAPRGLGITSSLGPREATRVTKQGGEGASRGRGSGGYVCEGLEGADEVPVLPHPDLVGLHGDGEGDSAAASRRC
jgi:hypothetical protein